MLISGNERNSNKRVGNTWKRKSGMNSFVTDTQALVKFMMGRNCPVHGGHNAD
jgi:hypothetical protein